MTRPLSVPATTDPEAIALIAQADQAIARIDAVLAANERRDDADVD